MDQDMKVGQLTDLAASTLELAKELRGISPDKAGHAAAAGKLYVTLADMLRTGTPRRRWVAPALRTADMHAGQAGVAPCAELLLHLLYGGRD
jgi:hypothetical protein